MSTATFDFPVVADLAVHRFLCHHCSHRLCLTHANANGELCCPSCSTRLCAPPPAADDADELPVSSPAPSTRRKPPQVRTTRSALLMEQGTTLSLQGEETFEHWIEVMADLPNTPFPSVTTSPFSPFGEAPAPVAVPAMAASATGHPRRRPARTKLGWGGILAAILPRSRRHG